MGFSDESWWEKGSCRTANPEIFDGRPHKGGRPRKDGRPSRSTHARDWSAAKAMCASCPVQRECLEYVLSIPQDWHADAAFAAGYTPDQLTEIRKRKARRR